jgi:ankyrin repeat protein
MSIVELVHEGTDAIVKYLASGGDVNYQDFTPVLGDGRSMLHEAAVSGLMDVVKLLLSQGAKINLLSLSLQSPLWEACNADQTEVALYLLSAGADVNSRNVGGYTPYGRIPGTNTVLINALLSAGATL